MYKKIPTCIADQSQSHIVSSWKANDTINGYTAEISMCVIKNGLFEVWILFRFSVDTGQRLILAILESNACPVSIMQHNTWEIKSHFSDTFGTIVIAVC